MNTYMPYMGGNILRPNGVMPTPLTPQPTPQVQQGKNQAYYCFMVDSYKDITSAGLPYDGTPVLFMLTNSPHLYMAYMNGEKKYICGYKIVEMDIESSRETQKEEASPTENAVSVNAEDKAIKSLESLVTAFEGRISKLEGSIEDLKSFIVKGGRTNESNISEVKPVTPTIGKKQ